MDEPTTVESTEQSYQVSTDYVTAEPSAGGHPDVVGALVGVSLAVVLPIVVLVLLICLYKNRNANTHYTSKTIEVPANNDTTLPRIFNKEKRDFATFDKRSLEESKHREPSNTAHRLKPIELFQERDLQVSRKWSSDIGNRCHIGRRPTFWELPHIPEVHLPIQIKSVSRVDFYQKKSKAYCSESADLKNEEGIYYISEQNITISNPNTMDYGLTSIAITSQPVTEKEFDTPEGTHILSKIITLEPHGMVFEKHILVKFPIYQHRYRLDQDVCLMYSDGSCEGDGKKRWVNISQHKTPALHKDEIFWFINQGFCYMFLRHFSHIFLLEVPPSSNTVPAQYGIFLLVSVFGKYVKNKLIITVGFHCHRCFANLLEPKGSFGTLLGYKLHCVYSLQGPVTIHIAVDNNNDWKCFNPEQNISVDQLFPLCNIDAISNNTVEFIATREVNVDREVSIDVKVLQDQNESNVFVTTCLKDLSEATTADACVNTDFKDINQKLTQTTPPIEVRIKTNSEVKISETPNIMKSNQPNLGNCPVESSFVGTSDMLNLPVGSGGLTIDLDIPNNIMINAQPVTDNSKMQTTTNVCTIPKHPCISPTCSEESCEQSLPLCQNRGNPKVNQDNDTPMMKENKAAVVAIPDGLTQISNIFPYVVQHKQTCNIFNINYIQGNNSIDHQLPEIDCVFNRSVVSEQVKLCDIIDNDCKDQLAEIAKAVGDTNGTVDMKNITALSLLQVWKVHVKEGKCTWRKFYDMLVKLECQSAALQLKVVCDKDSLVRGLNKLKRDISLDIELCGILLELDVIDSAENDEINLMKSPPEKISFLVLELLVKKPCNYERVQGFFQALHSMRYYGDYIREFLLCPEELDQIEVFI